MTEKLPDNIAVAAAAAASNVVPLAPPCPAELSDGAKQEWGRIVGELVANDVVTQFDVGILAVYCNAYAGWLEAIEKINEFGAMIKSPNGHPIQSPYVAIANRHSDTMLRCAAELGLTPASRAKLFPSKDNLELADLWGSNS